MLDGFKKFIMQGNVVDLAVGIVIGAAFGKVIDAFISGIMNPLIALLMGNKAGGIEKAGLQIGEQTLAFGLVISGIITFVATAAAVYFFVVVPMNKSKEKRGIDTDGPSNEEKMVELLEQIAGRG